MHITGASYTDCLIYLSKESSIVRVKKVDYFANVSVPLLKKFFYSSIVTQVCKDYLPNHHHNHIFISYFHFISFTLFFINILLLYVYCVGDTYV